MQFYFHKGNIIAKLKRSYSLHWLIRDQSRFLEGHDPDQVYILPGERNANNEGIIFSSVLDVLHIASPQTGNKVITRYSLQTPGVGGRSVIIAKIFVVHILVCE